jgi:hypothetical protein
MHLAAIFRVVIGGTLVPAFLAAIVASKEPWGYYSLCAVARPARR